MSRRHQPPTPVAHPYWPHSDPEPPATPADDEATPCPGPCNTAHRRAVLDNPTQDTIQPHPGRPVWCVDVHAFNDQGVMLDRLDHHGCTTLILDRLAQLPDLAAALTPGRLPTPRDADIDHGNTTHTGARGIAHAPSPSPGWDTADELIRWLVHLEDWTRHRLHDPGRPVAYRTLSAAVAYLHGHGPALLAGPDAAQVGQDVLDTHRRLERLVGHDRLTHRLAEPCPRCGRKGLRRRDGDELVRCGSCRAVWDWDHFEWLARSYAETVTAGGGVS